MLEEVGPKSLRAMQGLEICVNATDVLTLQE